MGYCDGTARCGGGWANLSFMLEMPDGIFALAREQLLIFVMCCAKRGLQTKMVAELAGGLATHIAEIIEPDINPTPAHEEGNVKFRLPLS